LTRRDFATLPLRVGRGRKKVNMETKKV